jgi:hypothetical protein
MTIPTGKGTGSAFAGWLHRHKKWLSIIGAAIAISTYVSKEILQSRMEGTIQSLERWQQETRFGVRLDQIEPNLRDEVSRGTDSKRRFADQARKSWIGGGRGKPGEARFWEVSARNKRILFRRNCRQSDSNRLHGRLVAQVLNGWRDPI